MNDSKEKTKIWTTIASFQTYEEAAVQKETLADQYDLIKIKVSDRRKDQWTFKVKVWRQPTIDEIKKKKSSKKKKATSAK